MGDKQSQITIPPGLGCQSCGAHTHTVRLVAFPYVICFGLYVSHGEFKGRWCWKHQTFYALMAAFISATLGFLGIPGLFFVPKIIIKLASGGIQHKANNSRQLRSLADAFVESGQPGLALDCLSESFLFVDDFWVRQAWNELRSRVSPDNESKSGTQPYRRDLIFFLKLTGLAVLLGILLGIVDYFMMDFVFNQWLFEFYLLQPLLEWVVILGAGSTIVLFLTRKLFDHSVSYKMNLMLLFLTGFSVLLGFVSGILTGRGIGNFVEIFIGTHSLPPAQNLFTAILALLFRSPLLELVRSMQLSSIDDSARLIYLFCLTILAIVIMAAGVWDFIDKKKRLRLLDGEREIPANLFSSFVPFSVGLTLILAFWTIDQFIPQLEIVDFLQSRDHYFAGVDFENKAQYSDAKSEFEHAVKLDPFMAEAYSELGWVFDQLGQDLDALNAFRTSVKLNPDQADTWYWYGYTAYFADEISESAEAFKQAVKLSPDQAENYSGLGWAFYELGDLNQAQTNFEKAIELDPGLYDAYLGLGSVYEDSGSFNELISIYKTAAVIESAPPEAFLNLGWAYGKAYQFDLAAEALETVLVYQPDNMVAQTYLVRSYLQIGEYEQALSLTQRMLETNSESPENLALSASVHLAMNQIETARQEVVTAQAIQPKTDLAYSLLLNALLNGGWYQEAEAQTRLAMEKSFDRGEFYLYLADALAGQSMFSDAMIVCDKAAFSGVRQSDISLERAYVEYLEGNLQSSLEELKKGLDFDPLDPEIHAFLGRIYYEMDDHAQAVLNARKAVSINPFQKDAHLTLALAELSRNNLDNAITSAIRASELDPYNPTPHFVLGLSYDALNQEPAALYELNQFLDLAKEAFYSDEDIREAEEMVKKLKMSLGISG